MIYLSVNGRLICERIITNFDSALGPPEPITEGDDSPVLDRYPDREADDLEVPHAPDIGLHDEEALSLGPPPSWAWAHAVSCKVSGESEATSI